MIVGEPWKIESKDADRVFTGDGSAPFPFIMKELRRMKPEMVLSLELFNSGYWEMDANMLRKLYKKRGKTQRSRATHIKVPVWYDNRRVNLFFVRLGSGSKWKAFIHQ